LVLLVVGWLVVVWLVVSGWWCLAGLHRSILLRFRGSCFRVGLLARRYARQQSLSLLLQRK
jgi:hypothetical protein